MIRAGASSDRMAMLVLSAVTAAIVVRIAIDDHRYNAAVTAECARNPAAHVVVDRTYPGSPRRRCVVGISRWDTHALDGE